MPLTTEDTAAYFHPLCRPAVIMLLCQIWIENRCKNADEQTEHHPKLEVSEAIERRLQRLEEAAEVCVLRAPRSAKIERLNS
jgi:hypothetical protein